MHLLPLFVRLKSFLDLDPIFIRQPTEGFGVTVFFMLHYKAHGIAAAATAEAFVEFLAGRYGKGGRFFIVEGA